MTDRELLEAFLQQSGIDRLAQKPSGLPVVERAVLDGDERARHSVILYEGEGYSGFYVRFYFGEDGKLDCFGVWED